MGSIISPVAGADRPLADRLRARVALALRERVAGRDNAAQAALIWDTPGERWFTRSDPIWRVHAGASMFAAGIRALLLQSLHPLAMPGVANSCQLRAFWIAGGSLVVIGKRGRGRRVMLWQGTVGARWHHLAHAAAAGGVVCGLTSVGVTIRTRLRPTPAEEQALREVGTFLPPPPYRPTGESTARPRRPGPPPGHLARRRPGL
jgi:hypothetical protein